MFIKGILREELQNSMQIKKDYQLALAKLPKGCLVRKIIKGHPYYYLVFREGHRVRYVYKGKLSEDQIQEFEEAKKDRAMYRKHLSGVQKQIRFLRKVLRGKESV